MTQIDHHALARQHGHGTLDTVSFTQISGWAWNPDSPDESVLIEVLDGTEQLAVLRADLYRPDLQKLGMGNGRHGFSFGFAGTILPQARHLIRVRRLSDGTDLQTSPRLIERDGGTLDDANMRHVAAMFQAEAAVARSPQALNPALAFAVQQLGVLMAAQRRLAEPAAAPDPDGLRKLVEVVAPQSWVSAAGQSMAHHYPPLVLPTASQPRVSVVIPVYGKFQLTYDCLKSIAEHPPEVPFEVIVVDDCSPDETLIAPLVFGGSVRVLRNDRNLGFVGTCNRGADAARGEWLFFLNNDTLVKPGWLDALVQTFECQPDIGIAGSKLLFGDGSLQEAGGIIWRMGDGWNWGRNARADEPRFSYLRDVDYVSGAALMIRKPMFDELGGFDLHFAPAYYEDTDLCFRVRQAGKRVVMQPASVIVHLEGQTAGTSVTGSGMKRYQAINHRKFYDRWRQVLSAHRFNAQQPELECERLVTRRAVFIDDSVPTPDQDAGSNAAFQHIRSLQRLGYKVTFIPADNMARISPYTEKLQALGVECIYYPYFMSVEEYFRKSLVSIDLVYLHRFSNGSKYPGLIRRHQPKARIVYNVADLHYLRIEREAELTGSAELASQAATVRQGELATIGAVDATIVHSGIEQRLLATTVPSATVHVVPWAYPLRPVATPAAQRSGVVFVGGYRHKPNVDAATWLVEEIMPRVWQVLPGLPCSLVGSHMPESVRAMASAHVEAIGFVPDVNTIYEQRLLSVAPLRYGAGVKGKVLEAFAAGLPCLMTGCAAEGVALHGDLQTLVADDAEGIAKLIIALHRNPLRVAALGTAGQRMMARHYSEGAVDAAIRGVVEPDVGTPPEAK
ncbi:glycosyltransferase [Ideonella sp.]|uniref:glycosyltransferase n=1 Tax=Ideonella sp. TaxID=1929293 RepID=UPI003BB714BC